VAALSKPDARPDARGQASDERLRLLRELGAQAVPSWAALESRPGTDARLVVVERAERQQFEDGEIADWIRDARRLSALHHPNVARVRDVVIRSDEILVVSEFVDGVRWRELATTATLETALRVFVDALAGLSALHALRGAGDSGQQPMTLVHGGLIPDCIIVGLDGVASVVGASRPRSATARLAGRESAYLAPEVLLEDDSADARADVYSVGVMLWEALSQRRFLPDLQPSAIVTLLLSGRVPPVTIPESAPWAAPLAAIVTRALSADPDKRFRSAAAMATEVRRVAALKLPLTTRVATGVRASFGDAVKARRGELERGHVRASKAQLRGSRPSNDELAIDVTDEAGQAPPQPPQIASIAALPVPVPTAPVPLAVTAAPSPLAIPTAPLPLAVTAAPLPLAVTAAPLPLAVTTAAPFALPTLGALEASEPPRSRPSGTLRIAVAGCALVVIAVVTWWVASRGSDARPGEVRVAPSAGATSAAATPRQQASEAPAPEASATTTPTPAPLPAGSLSPMDARALSPASSLDPIPTPAPPGARPSAPSGARPSAPSGAPPARPKHSPPRPTYDPQGI
jgi:hypothetical protein